MPRPSLTPGRVKANRASLYRAYERRNGSGGRGRPPMTSILRDLQAGYDTRARMALQASAKPLERVGRPKATRTYTGAALERRKAWGRSWGAIVSERAKELT